MAIVLEAYTTEEQGSVVYFCEQKGSMEGKCLSRKAVHNRAKKFSPVEIATEPTVQRVGESVRVDRRIKNRQCNNCIRVIPWFNKEYNA
jgi:hypothetical protein